MLSASGSATWKRSWVRTRPIPPVRPRQILLKLLRSAGRHPLAESGAASLDTGGGCRGLLPVEKTAGLCRELTKWWTTLWAFARVGGVEPTNSVPERALRPAVLWRKGSVGADSTAGSCFVERLLTVIATCRQRGQRLLEFLVAAGEAAVRGGPPPSLISAPPGG